MIKYSIKDNRLVIGDTKVILEYPVLEICSRENKLFVLYDPDENLEGKGFQNLVAFNCEGELMWKSELPTRGDDCYYKVISIKPFVVASFSSYFCELDIRTGEIINKEFVK